jgi:hypothetical protein
VRCKPPKISCILSLGSTGTSRLSCLLKLKLKLSSSRHRKISTTTTYTVEFSFHNENLVSMKSMSKGDNQFYQQIGSLELETLLYTLRIE